MTRTASLRALALACVLPALGACNLTASQAQVQAALNTGTVVASQLTPGNLTALGATPADLNASAKALRTVRDYTAAFCLVEPSLATVANISLALTGGSAVAASATQIADAVCKAVTSATKAPVAYMAMETKKAPAKPAERTVKPGDQVEGDIVINGVTVHVNATVVAPPKK